jgi:hypothetical protein
MGLEIGPHVHTERAGAEIFLYLDIDRHLSSKRKRPVALNLYRSE